MALHLINLQALRLHRHVSLVDLVADLRLELFQVLPHRLLPEEKNALLLQLFVALLQDVIVPAVVLLDEHTRLQVLLVCGDRVLDCSVALVLTEVGPSRLDAGH